MLDTSVKKRPDRIVLSGALGSGKSSGKTTITHLVGVGVGEGITLFPLSCWDTPMGEL